MGSIMVVIWAPLHRRTPRHLSSEAFNANVNEAITLLRHRLVDPAFATIKQLDTRTFIIQNVVLWEHRRLRGMAQIRGDGVQLTWVGQAHLYHSFKIIICQLAR